MTQTTSKVWFITGSSRGLGRALAEAVLAAGHRLVATSRHPSDLSALMERYGDQVRAVALDVTKPESAQAAVKSAVDAFGRLDVVVNNAGYANTNSIEDFALDDFRDQFETNFYGAVHVTRAVLPILRAQRSGHILQVSSIGGRRGGTPGLSAYQAAKFALEGFSEVLATEVAPLGILVTIVEPGGFRTDWAGSSMQIHQVQPDYEPTVGAFAKRMRGGSQASRGDPKKAAQAMLQIAEVSDPPRRLLLGTDALFLAKMTEEERIAEDAMWHDLSASTDIDGMEDFAESDLAKMLVKQARS